MDPGGSALRSNVPQIRIVRIVAHDHFEHHGGAAAHVRAARLVPPPRFWWSANLATRLPFSRCLAASMS
jgi:hypothetical protein